MSRTENAAEKWKEIEDIFESLSELYAKTGVDWELNVNHCLTEPTCPIAIIAPEGTNMMRFGCHQNNITDAILQSARTAYASVIQGNEVEGNNPFTNSDDEIYPDFKTMYRRALQEKNAKQKAERELEAEKENEIILDKEKVIEIFGLDVVELAREYYETDSGKVLFAADVKTEFDIPLNDPDEVRSYLNRAYVARFVKK